MPERPFTAKEVRKIARERFLRGRRAESFYQRQLTSVSKQIGTLIRGFAPEGKVRDMPALQQALEQYSEMLRPWARSVSERMREEVGRRDAIAWAELAREMGRTLRLEVNRAPTGMAMKEALENQVILITSLPIDAARRVHQLTTEALIKSERASEIQKEILRSGSVTVSRAKTIARTETSRTASLLVESRAKYVGSSHYIWHTSRDSDVRPEHRILENKIFRWDDPPIAGSNGEHANPGCIYNCRCWAEPILPDFITDSEFFLRAA